MTTKTFLETARLRIRCHRDDDLGDLVLLANDWEVARWVGTMPHPYTEAAGIGWIAQVQQDHATSRPRRFAIALKESDRLIGGIGLDGNTGDGSKEPALGYWLGQPYWGNGYAREAVTAIVDYGFGVLGYEVIRAYTDPNNMRSQRVLLSSGLKQVGEIELIEPTKHGATRAPLFQVHREHRSVSGRMRIEPVEGELPAEFDVLRAEARAEGHQFLDRLAGDWASAVMRFTEPGEAFMAAHSGQVLAAVGGLTVDPTMPGAFRMRRFYVRQGFRRSGVARSIALMLLEKAFGVTTMVTVNAAPDSVPFWESLGFVPDRKAGHTHILPRATL